MEKEYQIVTKNIPDKNLQKLKHIRQRNQYGCYEENLEGMYTERGVYRLFRKYVNKQEYPFYQDWKQDMLKMGILLKGPKTELAVKRKGEHIVAEICITVKTIEDACNLVRQAYRDSDVCLGELFRNIEIQGLSIQEVVEVFSILYRELENDRVCRVNVEEKFFTFATAASRASRYHLAIFEFDFTNPTSKALVGLRPNPIFRTKLRWLHVSADTE